MAEALNGSFKAELVKLHGPWRTRIELETAIINSIYWYNERGHCAPTEYDQFWHTYTQPALAGTN